VLFYLDFSLEEDQQTFRADSNTIFIHNIESIVNKNFTHDTVTTESFDKNNTFDIENNITSVKQKPADMYENDTTVGPRNITNNNSSPSPMPIPTPSSSSSTIEMNQISTPMTGSWQNCTNETIIQNISNQNNDLDRHPDSVYAVVSCQNILFRIPQNSISNMVSSQEEIVYGILSGAHYKERRNSIRNTWGREGKDNKYFIVGGPWEDIQDEYEEEGDLLWIQIEEDYNNFLSLKTQMFFNVGYNIMNKDKSNIKYLFKTDDDSYIDTMRLSSTLLNNEPKNTKKGNHDKDYWGFCLNRYENVPRIGTFSIPIETYPENKIPIHCKGAGYALSRRFVDCAVGEGHVAQVRYLRIEDCATGMLAERCNISSVHDSRVNILPPKKTCSMEKLILQHYIKTEEDMQICHATSVTNNIP